MIKTFTNYQGNTFSLIDNITSDYSNDSVYAKKAQELTKEKHLSIFYSLKHVNNGVIDYAQYFTIPVNPIDIEKINRTYSHNHIIGIQYVDGYIPEFIYQKSSDGYEYEYECAEILERMGFENVEVTKASQDQGIDVIAIKDNLKYGIQCKYYESAVSNKAVQEAYTGAEYYGCDIAVVMTNSTFTKSAIDLAQRTGVKLWSGINGYEEVIL